MKRFACCILVLALVAALSSCGNYAVSGGIPAQGEGGSQAGEERTELTLWHYHEGSISRFMSEYCQEFSDFSRQSDVRALQLPFGAFKKQLSVSAAAGSLPDLVMVDNCDCVAYASMGIFKDITDIMADNGDLKDYCSQIMDTCYWEGRMYAVPANSNNLQIYYNKELFAAAGIEEIPRTWEELREAARLLTDENTYGFGMSAVNNEEGTFQYLPFQYTAGGNNYDLDSEAGLRALTFLTDLVKDGSMPKDVLLWAQSDVSTQFTSQNIAMMLMGCWVINTMEEESPVSFSWDNFPIPKDVTYGSVYGGENLAVIEGPNAEAAVEFMRWFIEYERNRAWNMDIGHFIPRGQLFEDAAFRGRPHWEMPVELIPYTVARPPDSSWPEISLGYQLALQEALSLQSTPEEAVKKGQAIIDKVKERELSRMEKE